MMHRQPKIIAIKAILLAVLLFGGSMAWAGQVAATVLHLSGPLMARKADGTVKILAQKSEVEQGDTLVTEKNTYAQIKFIDNSEITLRPGTTFTIDKFAYDAGKPDGDSAAFNLVKGGLRSITGLLGKRNHEKFSLKTPTATIGIRGTTFVVQYVQPVEGGKMPDGLAPTLVQGKTAVSSAPALPPGLHVQVIDGMIHVNNNGGGLNFSAGQFGYVASNIQPPVIVPNNPGLQFTPPPVFNSSQPGVKPPVGVSGTDRDAVDCIVR